MHDSWNAEPPGLGYTPAALAVPGPGGKEQRPDGSLGKATTPW